MFVEKEYIADLQKKNQNMLKIVREHQELESFSQLTPDFNQELAFFSRISGFFSQVYSETPFLTSNLFLSDNRVDVECLKRNGIGSAGLSVMKELAKYLHCQKIYARKVPAENTEEEMAKLTAFYDANGFSQTDDSDYITFDLNNYKDIPLFHLYEAEKPKESTQDENNEQRR